MTHHDGYDDEDDYVPPAPQLQTDCDECDEALDEPVLAKEDEPVFHPECDPATPPKYWLGPLNKSGSGVDKNEGQSFRRLNNMAEELVDFRKEWDDDLEGLYVSLDGKLTLAREWVDDPETVALAKYSEDNYRGVGVYNPDHPDRCWFGQRTQSGRLARPLARRYETVEQLALYATKETTGRGGLTESCRFLVMLPGGEYVDAHDWVQLPETQHLAAVADAREHQYDSLEAAARHVVELVHVEYRITHTGQRLVMLPDGELVDAFDWAQKRDTKELAGWTEILNKVRLRVTAVCPDCETRISVVTTRVVEGEVGEEIKVASALRCPRCERHANAEDRYVTIIDDDSAEDGGTPRHIDDDLPDHDGYDDDGDTGALSGSLDGDGGGLGAGNIDGPEHSEEFGLVFPTISEAVAGLPGAITYARELVTYLTDLAAYRALLPTPMNSPRRSSSHAAS